MFTMTELFDIAIRIEKNGKKTYRIASQKVENAKEELDAIIKEEQRHIYELKYLLAEDDIDDESSWE